MGRNEKRLTLIRLTGANALFALSVGFSPAIVLALFGGSLPTYWGAAFVGGCAIAIVAIGAYAVATSDHHSRLAVHNGKNYAVLHPNKTAPLAVFLNSDLATEWRDAYLPDAEVAEVDDMLTALTHSQRENSY